MKRLWPLIWLGTMYLFLARTLPALAKGAVVRAVLFYSASCPHCHQVISEDLPPLLEAYGEQVDVVAVNTAHPVGQELYQATVQRFEVPQERQGVPMLIVGGNVLVGSLEIPQQLPMLIDSYLAQGGVGWPDIPGLAEILEDAEPTAPPATPTASPVPTTVVPTRRASADPAGTLPLVGTLFSIYLTFLEPFVIGATCLWCLTSAVVITLILLLTADGGRAALAELAANGDKGHFQSGSEGPLPK